MSGGVPEAALNARAQQALDLLRQGQRLEAEALLHEILQLQPRHFHALHLLGIVALEKHDASGALPFLNAALEVDSQVAAAHSNLAVALLRLQRPAQSLECCERALAIDSQHAQAYSNRGHALRALARPAEALVSYDAALRLDPNLLEGQVGRGNAWFDLRRYEDALAQFVHALQRQPTSEFLLNDVARTLLRLHRPDEALAALDRALERNPAFIEALNNRGSALRELRRPEAALASYREALRQDASHCDVYSNVANLLLQLGRPQEALDASERALACNPQLIEAIAVSAQALRSLGRLQESMLAQKRVLELDPDHPYALGKYVHALAAVCDWSQQQELTARIDAGMSAGKRLCTPMIYLALSGSSAAQWQCARAYMADVLPASTPGALAPFGHERIRIAYISADFRDHPVAHLLAGVLERHDRRAFEVHGISTDLERRGDPVRERIENAVERFHDLAERSDREVALLLRALEVDIAVDLGGHTRGARLGILAYRPAPIQVSFLGFMGTTGADFLDYVIGDAMALPAQLQPFFSEQIVHLPHCFLPNDDRQPIATRPWSRTAAGLPTTARVFCAFHSSHKINAAMFELWLRLLREVPDGVLWLKDGEAAMRENLCTQAALHRVDPARLVFAPVVTSMSEHLARYRVADLFLDTTPYGAHTTARDALWAGLPVLTCRGDALASRVSASLLHALGLDELIADGPEDYLARAVSLARAPHALADIRARLALGRDAGPAFSTARYCKDLESAFAVMVDRHARGEPAQAFAVTASRDWRSVSRADR